VAVAEARAEVLARVRAALADVAGAEVPEPAREYRLTSGLDRAAAVAMFAERAAEYRVGVRRIAGEGLAEAIAEALGQHRAQRIAIPADLPAELRPDGFELIEDDGLEPGELDALDGALTASALAIAETGTVVLDGGAGQGRRALSLVPDLHVCVVAAERVVGSLPEAIAELADGARSAARPLTFVSGPSATSDIELKRVEGVHGPRQLELVIAE
jgi:L-lactate dehydrogenase complex protein LldG